MFRSTGTLHYEMANTAPPYKLVLLVDPDLATYYFTSIPKSVRARRQAFAAHVSVVRKEAPLHAAAWGKYEGEVVEFWYEHNVRQDNVYLWLDAYSTRLEELRTELGLHNAPLYPATYHTPMPEGYPFKKRFHITLGNTKEVV